VDKTARRTLQKQEQKAKLEIFPRSKMKTRLWAERELPALDWRRSGLETGHPVKSYDLFISPAHPAIRLCSLSRLDNPPPCPATGDGFLCVHQAHETRGFSLSIRFARMRSPWNEVVLVKRGRLGESALLISLLILVVLAIAQHFIVNGYPFGP
jgi:hypothetical protein